MNWASECSRTKYHLACSECFWLLTPPLASASVAGVVGALLLSELGSFALKERPRSVIAAVQAGADHLQVLLLWLPISLPTESCSGV